MLELLPYQPRWPGEFQGFARALRAALADTALAIHPIGWQPPPGDA